MDLTELRGQIDEIDDEIIKLFCRRMDIAAQVADYKKANNLPIFMPARRKRPARKWPPTRERCIPCSSN